MGSIMASVRLRPRRGWEIQRGICRVSCQLRDGARRAHQRRPSRKHFCREGRRHFGTVSMSVKRLVMPAPHPKERRIIFENIAKPGYDGDIDAFLANGGYESLRKAVTMKPGEIVDAVKASNLRGRGGAGFPCGAKWGCINSVAVSRNITL